MIFTDVQGKVTYDSLRFYIDRLSRQHNLPSEIRDILLEQADRLRVIYGNQMDKADVLRVLAHQLELTKTGYLREPVDIVEFVESPEYMGQGLHVRPAIMDHLVRMFDPEKVYHEVVAGGAIGIGKNYFADMAMAYDLYKMSCLFSPQAHYSLGPGSSIVFSLQSKRFELAKKVIFQQFKERLTLSHYFSSQFPPSPLIKAELQFPHNITVMPVSTTDTAALGMNIVCATLDELNFMAKQRSKDSSVQDLAERLYTTIVRRIESRFTIANQSAGRVYLLSSARHKGDFIDLKEEEAKTNPHIFVMHLSQWEALPERMFSGKRFYIQLPSAHIRGKVFEDVPETAKLVDIQEARGKEFEVISVPEEYKKSFERDFLSAVRDIAGIPIERVSKFVELPLVREAQKRHFEYYGGQIFLDDVTTVTPSTKLEQIVDYEFLTKLIHAGPFSVHIDVGISEDSAGISASHVIGTKTAGTTHFPIYGTAGAVKVTPPTIGEIDIVKLGQIILELAKYIEVCVVTLDRYQSAYLIQLFRLNGIPCYILSVDRSPDPYDTFKQALKSGRTYLPPSEALVEEYESLERDASDGIVDHDSLGAKDLADAVTGSIHSLSQRRSSYRQIGEPKPLKTFVSQNISTRPSSGRSSLY